MPCSALTRAGKPCPNKPLQTGLCQAHDPAWAEWRKKIQKRGGRRTRLARTVRVAEVEDLPSAPTNTLEGLRVWMAWAIPKLACGELDQRTVDVLTRAITSQRGVLEKLHLAERLAVIERRLKEKPDAGI